MAEVVLEGVCKDFPNGVRAVDGFSLHVRDREFVVLVGPSGCGKTTTLRMIAGLEKATEGEIRIGQRVVNDVPPKDRDIAMVFQNYALYPHMTVFDNMGFSLKLRKAPKQEISERVGRAADILGLRDLLGRRPAQLSGGQRQRVALGRAIVRQPAAFLFDEPLSNLDAKMRVSMRGELKLLHQRLQATMVYVTHDQVEAMTLAQRLVVMNAARIEQVGEPLDVYNAPVNKFVAGFIGTPPISFFQGDLRSGGEDFGFDLGGTVLRVPAAKLRAGVGRPAHVRLGVRPEGFLPLDMAMQPAEPVLRAKVTVTEPLGDEVILHLTAHGQPFVAKVSSRHRCAVGERVALAIDPDKMHLFDDETGANLAAEAPATARGAPA